MIDAHLRAQGADALTRVAALLQDRAVALLCFEADPAACHRSIVVERLLDRVPRATVRSL